MVCHSLLQSTTFCQTSPTWPARPGWPHIALLSFIELDKAVVRVIRLVSFLWLWFQCVCPLMPSRNTYRLAWVSLTLGVGYLFMAVPAKCSFPSYCEHGVAPLGPPGPAQPLLLGRGVAPLSCLPWPWAWGSYPWPRFCAVRRIQRASVWSLEKIEEP